MIGYPNATLNAEEFINVPPFIAGYQAKEIEVFFGDSAENTTYYYRNGEWVDVNLENIDDESVIQISIDDQWAYIQAENEVLLDRMGGVELPEMPNKELFVSRISHHLRS